MLSSFLFPVLFLPLSFHWKNFIWTWEEIIIPSDIQDKIIHYEYFLFQTLLYVYCSELCLNFKSLE